MENKIAFIPVGISGSGKSTLARKWFKEHEIWGADKVRQLINGTLMYNSAIDRAAFVVLDSIIDQIARKGGYLFIDNLNLSSSSTKRVFKTLRENGYELVFIRMMDSYNVELCIERRKDTMIGENAIRDQYEKFMTYEWSDTDMVADSDAFSLNRSEPVIYKDNVMFIGDLHGQFKKFMDWCVEKDIDPLDDDSPFFVFLGDLVDRGPQSTELVKYVKYMVQHGRALCIRGNHEDTVYRILKGENVTSVNSQKTADEMIDKGFDQEFIEFVESLPYYASIHVGGNHFVASHAGVPYEPDAYPRTGWTNWLIMRGINTGTFKNRSMVGPHVFGNEHNVLQIHGHVNRSIAETGMFLVPYTRDNTICLESSIEDGDEFTVGHFHAVGHDAKSPYADERDPECNACQEPERYDDHTHST